ncbi:hypothetical protein F4780DRAFT_237701 [Xylariomycetidae sp. FL0641]|nr:hypothetical protein F4780DRAFT_237701 [Xylariomycetidae sp. FL0641]
MQGTQPYIDGTYLPTFRDDLSLPKAGHLVRWSSASAGSPSPLSWPVALAVVAGGGSLTNGGKTTHTSDTGRTYDGTTLPFSAAVVSCRLNVVAVKRAWWYPKVLVWTGRSWPVLRLLAVTVAVGISRGFVVVNCARDRKCNSRVGDLGECQPDLLPLSPRPRFCSIHKAHYRHSPAGSFILPRLTSLEGAARDLLAGLTQLYSASPVPRINLL